MQGSGNSLQNELQNAILLLRERIGGNNRFRFDCISMTKPAQNDIPFAECISCGPHEEFFTKNAILARILLDGLPEGPDLGIRRERVMKHPVDVHVGKRVRHRRWMVGMTQQQLADKVGIKFQQIQKYETGMNRISASRLWDIADALSVPINFFFEGLDSHSAAQVEEVTGDILADKEALLLVRSYYSIPEAQRRRLFDLAKVLSDAA